MPRTRNGGKRKASAAAVTNEPSATNHKRPRKRQRKEENVDHMDVDYETALLIAQLKTVSPQKAETNSSSERECEPLIPLKENGGRHISAAALGHRATEQKKNGPTTAASSQSSKKPAPCDAVPMNIPELVKTKMFEHEASKSAAAQKSVVEKVQPITPTPMNSPQPVKLQRQVNSSVTPTGSSHVETTCLHLPAAIKPKQRRASFVLVLSLLVLVAVSAAFQHRLPLSIFRDKSTSLFTRQGMSDRLSCVVPGDGVTLGEVGRVQLAAALTLLCSVLSLVMLPVVRNFLPSKTVKDTTELSRGKRGKSNRHYPHIVPAKSMELADITFREFLMHQDGIHLAMAPAFFGFYAYFGTLQAWDEAFSRKDFKVLEKQIKSVAGASAGAMAAILVSAGIPPKQAAAFCSTVTLGRFADPPGLGGAFKGHLFEQLMLDFMKQERPESSLQLEDSIIPVAVSGFDIKTLSGKILSRGNMARAARASATFPLLFQPAVWKTEEDSATSFLIDGGIADDLGLRGLSAFDSDKPKRIVNLVVGHFMTDGPRGPSKMPQGVVASEVLSLTIKNTPRCGPWAMENGPRAVEASRRAMLASLELPLYRGKEEGHYELHIDASNFVP